MYSTEFNHFQNECIHETNIIQIVFVHLIKKSVTLLRKLLVNHKRNKYSLTIFYEIGYYSIL